MHLDWQVCSRARLSRDARFDGKFFIAVLTSKVYCRSICPAPTAQEKNCRYYPTAAAAAEAGFRPCLRCRPECSPGTPAWLGTPSTVSRALRLIAESGLTDGVEALAEHLGVGSRHLRRLFLQHLGATPSAVAQTRRLHFAKKLIDETRLPMREVALASGFGCVRRFNAAIRQVYRRTPTDIRRLSRSSGAPANQYLFRLRYRPPYDWDGLLRFLAPRITPGVEAIDGGVYRRTISLEGRPGWIEVRHDAPNDTVVLRVQFDDPRALYAIVERVRSMFDLNADWAAIARGLAVDPDLAMATEARPGLRMPGCWDGFELAVRALLGSPAVAAQLVWLFGRPSPAPGGLTHIFPTPEVLAGGSSADAIRALARAACDGRIRFHGIVDSQDFLARLRAIPGIDECTAQYVAMRALGEPDAFPCNDPELHRRAEAWRPWRAYAFLYLSGTAALRLTA